MSHPYFGQEVLFATKHEKEKILNPLFNEFGLKLKVGSFNTDLLGTFTGEIPRTGTPTEVAIKKARKGIEGSQLRLALASEGSIAPDPLVPFVVSDLEILAFIDTELDIEVIESYRSYEITTATSEFLPNDPLDDFLTKADFPRHRLIAKSKVSSEVFKGISSFEELKESIKRLHDQTGEKVILESDLRAHMSPSRAINIARCGEKLISRLANLCKKCEVPGFGLIGFEYGVTCSQCHVKNMRVASAEVHGCPSCDFRMSLSRNLELADPASCSICNP